LPSGPKAANAERPSSVEQDSPMTEEPVYPDPIPKIEIRQRAKESEVYHHVQEYILMTPDRSRKFSVPGTDICLAGDRLRTKRRFTYNSTVTDESKCRLIGSRADGDERMVCAPDAERTVVHDQGYLSSPVRYEENVCLEYDRSHCYIRRVEDSEEEVCEVTFKYEGIWATGTIFDYQCKRWATRVLEHPLQYLIRYLVEVEKAEGPSRTSEKHRVTVPVQLCR